jgi:hypothetical protein
MGSIWNNEKLQYFWWLLHVLLKWVDFTGQKSPICPSWSRAWLSQLIGRRLLANHALGKIPSASMEPLFAQQVVPRWLNRRDWAIYWSDRSHPVNEVRTLIHLDPADIREMVCRLSYQPSCPNLARLIWKIQSATAGHLCERNDFHEFSRSR